MKKIKYLSKDLKYAIGVILTLHCLILTAAAAGDAKVMQTHTGESEIAIYVKGIEEDFSNASVQIGTAECKSVRAGRLSESKNPVKTLVMVDNSLSIPEPARAANAQILQNIISDREAYEQIAIATFDEEIRYIAEYTSDYSTLKTAVDNISYQNLETRLTDVLYGLLSDEYLKDMEDAYCRIVVLSDGVDSKSANCTKAELESIINKSQIPIYTLGIGKDEAQLGEMFALSRLSNGDSFKLDGMKNLMDINAALNADRNIVRFSLSPQSELMDGSRKMIKIALASGNSISVETVMPHQAQPEKKIPAETAAATPASAEVSVETAVESSMEETAKPPYAVLVIAAIALAAAVIAVFAILRARKGKKEAPSQERNKNQASDANKNQDNENIHVRDYTSIKDDEGRNTVLLFGNNENGAVSDIILTDMDSPVRTFSIPLKSTISIGADAGCDIKITTDDYISRRHCKIESRDGKFYLDDTKSSNGTFLNGSRISFMTEIVPGDSIKIGDTRLRFDVKD